ncbi:hypothetical protein HD806DRAFT_537357 [Xylariaceae sp. AK1471]|nr:hypothetical protein HD806DRAFT_537357 [Xylariaceae sp. AK1471]
MSGNSDSDDEPPAYSEVAPPTAYLRFPSELSLYNVASELYLAARRTQPLHHVQVNYRRVMPVDAEIALGTGPDGEFPAYATIRLYGSNISIWAPKQSELDMSQVAISATPPTGPFGIVHGSWTFTVPVQDTGRLEEFEWRHSVLPEVLSVSSEWKLERRQPSQSGEASGSSSGAGAPKPTEKETVATLSFKKNSRSKMFTLKFEGSGANGELGDRWAIVTILTALAIYYHMPGGGSATTSNIGEGSSTS